MTEVVKPEGEALGADVERDVRASPVLRLLAPVASVWLGFVVGGAIAGAIAGVLCGTLCSAITSVVGAVLAGLAGGAAGSLAAVRAARASSDRGLLAVAAGVGFVVAGTLGTGVGELFDRGEPVHRNRAEVVAECGTAAADLHRRRPRWCPPVGEPARRVLVRYEDEFDLPWAAHGALALGAIGGGAGALLESRALRRRRRRTAKGTLVRVQTRVPRQPLGEEVDRPSGTRLFYGRASIWLGIVAWVALVAASGQCGMNAGWLLALFLAGAVLMWIGLRTVKTRRYGSARNDDMVRAALVLGLGIVVALAAAWSGAWACFTF